MKSKLISRYAAVLNSYLQWTLFHPNMENHEEPDTKLLLVGGHLKIFENILENLYCSKLQVSESKHFK